MTFAVVHAQFTLNLITCLCAVYTGRHDNH